MSTRSTSPRDPPRESSSAATGAPSFPAAQDALRLLLSMGSELEQRNPARAADCLHQAVDLARDLNDGRAEGEALLRWGTIESQIGHLTEAEPLLVGALVHLRNQDDPIALAHGLNKNALLRLRQGRTEKALTHLRESLKQTSESETGSAVRADALDLLAMAYLMKGDPDQALRFCQEALELRRAVGDAAAIAKTLNQFGNLRHRLGHYQEAVTCYRQALETLRTSDDERATAATANNLASTLLRLGELAEAQEIFNECRARFEALGEEGRVADVLSNLGLLAHARGQMDAAGEHYRASLSIQQKLGKPMNASHALTNLSLLSIARGRCEEAVTHADESITLLRKNDLQDTVASALVCKATALLELGETNEARAIATEAERAAEHAHSQDQLAEVRILWAEIHRFAGDLDAALSASQEALRLAEEIGDPELSATAHRCHGAIRLSRGELEEAKRVLMKAGRLLRGWERSYERARILYEEGLLLLRAGSRQAAAERLRRVAEDFAQLGNRRWQIRTGMQLAHIVAELDPAQAQAHRREAVLLATQYDLQDFYAELLRSLTTLDTQPADDHARGLYTLTTTLQHASQEDQPNAAGLFEAFFAFLDDATEIPWARLSLRGEALARWQPQAGPHFTAMFRAGERAPVLDLVSGPANRAPSGTAGQLPWPGLLAGEFEWRRAGNAPLSERERRHLTLALHILALALDAQVERAAQTAAPRMELGAEQRFEHLVGSSPPMRALYRRIEQVAPSDSSVLISGESGTGKELIARSIHARSRRSQGPFVAISCPSIPKDLLESELFGHERGAFTGAVAAHPGRIELADGGTLFLDEIGDMPLATQAKILRFLQEREFQRVGGHALHRVDVRLLSATSRDLHVEMKQSRFREDLYYRLNVVPLRAPKLRERKEDIPPLAEHFLRQFTREREGRPRRLSQGLLDRLREHDWPGNVRELRNTIEYLTTVCEAEVIGAEQLPPEIGGAPGPLATRPALQPGETLASRLMDLEASLVREALTAEDWNQSAAARRLGITESKIRNRMKQYGLRRPNASQGGAK